MDNIIYMGGFDIEANAKTMGTLNIRTTRIDDLRYLLDYTLDPLDVLLYYITYRYNNVIYQTPVVVSYKPLESKPLIDVNPRPCLTARNIRYRGPNESAKYNAHSKEVFCDMRNLNSFKDIVANDNNDNLDEIDSLYRSVYNSTDRLMLYNKLVLGSL
jgi:hypothetical protein